MFNRSMHCTRQGALIIKVICYILFPVREGASICVGATDGIVHLSNDCTALTA